MPENRATALSKHDFAATGGSPPIRLFVKLPEGAAPPRRRPSWLARAFRLELYLDSPLLTTRALREMNLAAVLLLVVSAFELAIWTALFHDLFGAVAAALLAGLAFATVVCYFERQLIVHDEVAHGRAGTAMWVRLGYILLGAFITSHTLELRIFGEPIRTRVHAEEVRREALARLSLLGVQEANLQALTRAASEDSRDAASEAAAGSVAAGQVAGGPASGTALNPLAFKVQTKLERTQLDQADRAVAEMTDQLAAVTSRLASAEGELRAVNGEIRALRLQPDTESREQDEVRLEAERRAGQARREQLTAERREWEVRLENARGVKKIAAIKLGDKELARQQELDRVKGEVDALTGRLEKWVSQLQGAKPDAPVAEAGGDWTFQEQPYNFLQKLRIVYDLLAGRGARWQGGTPVDVERLRSQFNLYEPHLCEGKPSGASEPCDAEESGRVAQDLTIFRGVYAVGFGIALYIPLLVITIKRFLFPEDLRLYYSRQHQQEAGQLEAVLVAGVNERVRGRRASGEVSNAHP